MEAELIEPTEKAANDEQAKESTPQIERKMRFSGQVVAITIGGALIDIGLDQPAFLHISRIKEDPVNRVEDVLEVGQTIEVWVRRVDRNTGRIELTMIEPLDMEWREIKKGLVVKGKVTRIEKFGVFVEFGAERPGMVHISELTHGFIRTPEEVVKVGDEIEVKVLGVNRRKKRIKLSRKALEEFHRKPPKQERKEVEPDKPEPTAMEVAMREAMERAKSDDEPEEPAAGTSKRKPEAKEELDEILSRTLEQQPGS